MDGEILYLTDAVCDEIVEHAREGKPEEVCGIVRGRDHKAFQVVRGRNVAPDPMLDYDLDPQTLLRQFEFEDEGDELVAVYHSHPVSPAYPSASDAWNAHYPDVAYIICSLEDDHHPVIRAFRLQEHKVPLDPEKLRAEPGFDETRPGRFGYYQAEGVPLSPTLSALGADVPSPFYVVFEAPPDRGKEIAFRVVSVGEYQIEKVAG